MESLNGILTSKRKGKEENCKEREKLSGTWLLTELNAIYRGEQNRHLEMEYNRTQCTMA